MDPKIKFVIADGPTPGNWTGLAGMAEGRREVLSAWAGWRDEVDDHHELDDERVLVLARKRGRGKTNGLKLGQMQTKSAGMFQLRDGKVTRLVFYLDRERALAELGLD